MYRKKVNGISRKELSIMSGVSESMIQKYENGQNIGLDNFLNLCKAMNIECFITQNVN